MRELIYKFPDIMENLNTIKLGPFLIETETLVTDDKVIKAYISKWASVIIFQLPYPPFVSCYIKLLNRWTFLSVCNLVR